MSGFYSGLGIIWVAKHFGIIFKSDCKFSKNGCHQQSCKQMVLDWWATQKLKQP